MNELPLSIDGGTATITINRPAQRNAITFAMWTHFVELFHRTGEDDRVRILVLRGAEGTFSAGGDIGEFPHQRNNQRQAQIYNGKVELALRTLGRLSIPTVAVIEGDCVGGGFMLAAHCDLRLVAHDAQLGVPVGLLGALVNYIEIERLLHLLGRGATLDLLLTGRMLDAQAALRIGYATKLMAAERMDEEVELFMEQMLRVAPLTQVWHKKMLQTVLQKPDLLDLEMDEASLPDACFDTEDYAEGVRSFLEKREPRFRGR